MAAIRRNISAQLYSQVVTISVQIGLVPLLISAWGVEAYGVWITLTAIPMYLMLSDFGFTFVAKNDMSIRFSSGDVEGALRTYQSVLVLLLFLCASIFIVLTCFFLLLPIDEVVNISGSSLQTARTVLISQLASVMLYQFFQLFNASIRCVGRAATEITVTATSRLAEASTWAATALLGGGLADAAVNGMLVRALMLLGVGVWVHAATPWLRLGFDKATYLRIRELLSPSLNFMLIPMSSSLLMQAPLIVLGIVSNPSTVALFSVSRTVARLGMSAANVLNHSFAPEYSFAYGRNDMKRFVSNFRVHLRAVLVGGAVYITFGTVMLPLGVQIISRGRIEASILFGSILTISVLGEVAWRTFLSPLSAINLHKVAARAIAAVSVAAFCTLFLAQGIHGVALTVMVANLILGIALLIIFRPAFYKISGGGHTL